MAERLDIAVRIREMRSSTLKARRLGQARAVVFGSPSYFLRRGRPNHPDELAQHDCVVRLTDGEGEAWPFRIAGRRRLVRVSGRVRTDSTAAANTAVACGAGIGFAPLWLGAQPRRSRRGRNHPGGIRGNPGADPRGPAADAGAAGEGAAVCGGDDCAPQTCSDCDFCRLPLVLRGASQASARVDASTSLPSSESALAAQFLY